jgi:hypothetical protein
LHLFQLTLYHTSQTFCAPKYPKTACQYLKMRQYSKEHLTTIELVAENKHFFAGYMI